MLNYIFLLLSYCSIKRLSVIKVLSVKVFRKLISAVFSCVEIAIPDATNESTVADDLIPEL